MSCVSYSFLQNYSLYKVHLIWDEKATFESNTLSDIQLQKWLQIGLSLTGELTSYWHAMINGFYAMINKKTYHFRKMNRMFSEINLYKKLKYYWKSLPVLHPEHKISQACFKIIIILYFAIGINLRSLLSGWKQL